MPFWRPPLWDVIDSLWASFSSFCVSFSFIEVFLRSHSNPLGIYIIINTLKLSKSSWTVSRSQYIFGFFFLRFQRFLTTLFYFLKSQSKFVVAIVFLGDLINLMCCLIFLLLCKSHSKVSLVCGVWCGVVWCGVVCVCVCVWCPGWESYCSPSLMSAIPQQLYVYTPEGIWVYHKSKSASKPAEEWERMKANKRMMTWSHRSQVGQ